MLIFTHYALQRIFHNKCKVLSSFKEVSLQQQTDIGKGVILTFSSGPFPSCEEMAVLIPHGRVKNPDDGLSIVA